MILIIYPNNFLATYTYTCIAILPDKFFVMFLIEDAKDDTYWDSKASPEDMEAMWNHPVVRKVWIKSKETHGKVRFSNDEKKRPYLSRVEMKV